MKLINNTGRVRKLHGPIEMYHLEPHGEINVTEQEVRDLKRHVNTRNWLHKGYISFEGGEAKEPLTKVKDERHHPELPEGVEGEGTEIHHHGAGWYSVFHDGMPCTDAKVRKDEAEAIAAEYE